MKQKPLHILLIVLSFILMSVGLFVLKLEAYKSVSGVCLGIGSGLFGATISHMWAVHFYKKHPQEKKQSEIEFSDERNTMIRNKAKAKSADIIQWFIIGIAFVTILINAPLWLTLTVVGVFLLKTVLEIYLMNKYQKEM